MPLHRRLWSKMGCFKYLQITDQTRKRFFQGWDEADAFEVAHCQRQVGHGSKRPDSFELGKVSKRVSCKIQAKLKLIL